MSTFDSSTGKLAPESMLQHRYIIAGQVGRGGMSAVYAALDTRLGNRYVAIKEMSQGNLDDVELMRATERFQREAALLGSLHHPNLPRIYDAFSEQGRSYLVMDFIEGKTLLQLLKDSQGQPLSSLQAVDYALQLCNVLIYLHSQQPPIIFRDLKPTNVIVTEDGHVFLIDFGIARFFKEGQGQDTEYLGSPGYAPPEQHGSSQTNPRSDLYGLGATLHFCLTGRDPYYAENRFVFPPVRQYNPQVPIALEQLILRLVSINEQQRPASAQEVQQALLQLRQQATGNTVQISPSPASAPTHYISPAPATNNSSSPAYPQTVPVGAGRLPAHSEMPHPKSPPTQFRTPAQGSSLWSVPFITLFALMLVVTTGISALAFNFIIGSDHLVEAGLSILLLCVAFGANLVVYGFMQRTILCITALTALVSGLTFLVQATPTLANLFQTINLNGLLTGGLAVAAIVSLFWLARPFQLLDRFLLLLILGGTIVCVFFQYPYGDWEVPKHILLLIALIALIEGVLLAAQAERVYKVEQGGITRKNTRGRV